MTNIFRPIFSKIWKITSNSQHTHCVKSVQIQLSSPNAGKYGPEQTSYLDTVNAVLLIWSKWKLSKLYSEVQDK